MPFQPLSFRTPVTPIRSYMPLGTATVVPISNDVQYGNSGPIAPNPGYLVAAQAAWDNLVNNNPGLTCESYRRMTPEQFGQLITYRWGITLYRVVDEPARFPPDIIAAINWLCRDKTKDGQTYPLGLIRHYPNPSGAVGDPSTMSPLVAGLIGAVLGVLGTKLLKF